MGNLIILNLFLAILLEGFDSDSDFENESNFKIKSKEELFRSLKNKDDRRKALREQILYELVNDDEEINTLHEFKAITMKKPQKSSEIVLKSYVFLSKDNKFRLGMIKIVSSNVFESVIVVIILLNVVKLI